jgi:hypothetical protein
MPTFDLRISAPVDVLECDVIAERTSVHVSHVALALERHNAVPLGGEMHTIHMKPPLESDRSVAAHVVGRLDLSNAQKRDIHDWIDDQTKALAAVSKLRQYYLLRNDASDRSSARESRRRFSCATFIQDCFRESIEVELVNEAALPATDRETLVRIWSQRMVDLGRHYGLEGEGPWPVLLPAHILHALDRDVPGESPYRPRDDDWDFPRPA